MSKLSGITIQKTVIAVCLLFLILIALSVGQYQIINQHRKIATVSSRILFQFNTVKEFVTRALLDKRYADLGDTVGELEDLNASVQSILQNPLIPDQLKSILLNRMDLSGMAILVRQVTTFADPQKVARLQEEIRISGEQILQFDRLLADHVKQKMVGYQSFVIGILLFAVLFLANVCFFVYLRLIAPLNNLKSYLSQLGEGPPPQARNVKRFGWLQELADIAQGLGKKQRELLSQKDLFGAVLGDCPLPLLACDSQGKIVLRNRAAEAALAVADTQPPASVFGLLADDQSRRLFRDGLARLVEDQGRKKQLQLTWAGAEKSVVLFKLAAKNNEALFGLVWQQSNNQSDDGRELPFNFRLALLGQLTCGVAHEIGDAVNSLLNYQDLALDSLKDGRSETEGANMLRAATVEGEKIAQRTRLLLETSQFRTKKDIFPLAQLVNESINLVRNQMKSDGVRIDVFLPPELPQVKCCFGMARLVCIEIFLFIGELFASFSEKRIEVRAAPVRSENGKAFVRLAVESPVHGRFLLKNNERALTGDEENDQISNWQCLMLLQEYLRQEGGDIHFASLDSGTSVQVDFPSS